MAASGADGGCGDPGGADLSLAAWRWRDSGLLPTPGATRGLPGAVRHHSHGGGSSAATPWPDRIALVAQPDGLVVHAAGGELLGRFPYERVSVPERHAGPPVSFVLDTPGGRGRWCAPAGPGTRRFLDDLVRRVTDTRA